MARTVLTPQQLQGFGQEMASAVSWSNTLATDDAEFENTGNELLLVRNDDASSQLVTVVGVDHVINFGQARDSAHTLTASGYMIFGPFEPAAFNQSDGYVHVDVADDDVQVAVIRLPAGA